MLIGGGHTHALFLDLWARSPLPDVRVRIINPSTHAPYTGMLPGFIAGHYTRRDLDIDLAALADRAGAELIIGAVDHIDPMGKKVRIAGKGPIAYDVASLNIGISSTVPDISGANEFAVPAKPLGAFSEEWERFLHSDRPARIAVIGAGVAGVELALAMSFALQQAGRPAEIFLIDRSQALSGLPAKASNFLRQRLKAYNVSLIEHCSIQQVCDHSVILGDGRLLEAEFILTCAGAPPPHWLRQCDLALENGYVSVSKHLQSSDPSVFAAGDIAHMSFAPRAKAGVYAVRQAPILFNNIQTVLGKKGRLQTFAPQKDFLKLISLGDKAALAQRGRLSLSVPGLWYLKDRIDRNFMARFQ